MDEIQNEPQEIEEDQVSASATDEDVIDDVSSDEQAPEEHQEEKVTFDERQQAKVNELISEKVAKIHKERSEKEAFEQRAKELEALIPVKEVPEIPPMPDPYSLTEAEFKAQVEARDKVIAERVEYDAKQRFANEQSQQIAQRQILEQQQKQHEAVEGYSKRAVEFGITPEQMQKDAMTVSELAPSIELQTYILNDTHGALITSYLANNVLELDKIRSMSLPNAAVHIATEIKPKLASTRKQSQAPKPVDIVGGNGVPEKKHPALEGVQFE